MNYEKDMEIDPNSLDVEWIDQPQLMMKYARHSAEAKRQADLAKERLDVIEAELDRDIRSNPDNYDIGKVTENAVHSTLILQDKYREARQELIDAQYEQEMAKSACIALSARKETLENLVKLFALQYFAGPSLPRDINKEWEDRMKQQSADAKVRIGGMKRGKKGREEDE